MKSELNIARLCFALLAAACIQNSFSKLETIRETPKRVQYGTVMGALPYTTDEPHSGAGMAIGAAIVGSTQIESGGWVEDPTMMVIAGVLGGYVGMEIEKAIGSERVVDVHILLENGDEIYVTQPNSKRKFKVHDAVKVLTYSNTTQQVYYHDEQVEWETNPYYVSEFEIADDPFEKPEVNSDRIKLQTRLTAAHEGCQKLWDREIEDFEKYNTLLIELKLLEMRGAEMPPEFQEEIMEVRAHTLHTTKNLRPALEQYKILENDYPTSNDISKRRNIISKIETEITKIETPQVLAKRER